MRRALAESLARKAAKRWIPLLTEAIDDADAEVRATAARALMEHGPEVFLAPMVRLLDDPAPSVRRVAIDGLASAGTPGLTALLAVHTGSRPASAQVVDEVDDALHRVAAHHPDGLVALIDLGKVDRSHTQRVANLLADCGPVGTDMLMAEMDAGLTQKAFYARRALAAYPGTAVPLINRRLLEVDLKDTKSALITPYLEVLRAAGDARALPALERLAKSKRPYLRAETMLVLGHIDDARAVELLVAGLTDADSDVRGAAADGLGQQRSVDGIKPLIRLVARGDAVSVKAIQALGKIGDARAALVLEQQLASDNPTVRRYACEALERIGHTSARDGLLEKLDDPDAMVRYTASRALGSME